MQSFNIFNNISRFIFAGFVLSSSSIFAQNNVDTLPELDQVNVIKSYEPVLIGANKVPVATSLPDISKAKPDAQTYNYTDVKGKITYQPEDIRPIRLGQKKAEKNQFFYAKIGGGFPAAALAEIAITNPIQTHYKAGADINMLYSNAIKPKYKDFLNFKAKGFAEGYIRKMAAIGGSLYFGVDNYKFYGFTDQIFSKDSLKTNFNRIGGNIFIKNINDGSFNYKLNADIASVIHKNVYHNPKEVTVDVTAQADYNFKKNYWAGALLRVNNVSYNDNYKDTTILGKLLNKQNHFSIQATPFFKVKFKIWQIWGGPSLIVTNRTFYVLPEIHNQIQIYKDYVVMYNEWTNQIKNNSLNVLSKENPWIVTQNYNNQLDETRTIFGLRGVIKGFGYDVKINHLVSHSNAQYYSYNTIPPYTPANNPFFDVQTVYKLQAWNPHFGISYNRGSEFGAKAWFDYLVYNKNTAQELSYVPKLKAGISAFYNWKNKLYVNMDIEGRTKVNGLVKEYGGFVGETSTLVPVKGLVDINFSANYFFNKNIGVFVDVNNVAFQKWQRYYKYPTYTFQVIAGAKFSF